MAVDVPTLFVNSRTYSTRRPRPLLVSAEMFRDGGGSFAGTFPDGLTRVEGVPTTAEVLVMLRAPGSQHDGLVVARTTSSPSGEWQIDGLSPRYRYTVLGRKGQHRDVLASDVSPYRPEVGFAPKYFRSTEFGTAGVAHDGFEWDGNAELPNTVAAGSFAGWTIRQVIPESVLAATESVRITIAAGSSMCVVEEIYAQRKAPSGDAYDFALTPVRLTSRGATSFHVPAGNKLTLDPAAITLLPGESIVVAAYLSTGNPLRNASATGWVRYQRSGNFAAPTDTSGFTLGGNNATDLVSRVECLVPV